ncbi:RHS repeat-associated core domain-containing protein [Pseudodesulfovibrio sp.]|uniref:RHS repeat-associated core domain-containing protein n=1 Tax=unclassified Pseudodesulfovibrio TaxID=2661612 RepID=UPI003B00F1E2
MIKEVLYDPLGGIIKDTNPGFRIPIGFAGGLHDRDLGFVRFDWRDYDTFTDRWTAPDPLGDKGGDPDWYGYCLDDPVNGADPLGLMGVVQYLPEINRAGIFISNEVSTGQPGWFDIPGKVQEAGKWYLETVDKNIQKIQEGRRDSTRDRNQR